jgi:hypothetical protein
MLGFGMVYPVKSATTTTTTPARDVAADSVLKHAATILKNAFIVVVIAKTNRKKMLHLHSARLDSCIKCKTYKN